VVRSFAEWVSRRSAAVAAGLRPAPEHPNRAPEVLQPPAVGGVNFGDLRSVAPFSRHWGFDRGLPIDRYFIESFLQRCSVDIRGRVLEIGDATYTKRFGQGRVERSDVLHISGNSASATIVGDLADGENIPSNVFDCLVITQTLQFVYDFHAAMRTLYRALAPGGVLLLTVPGISQTTDKDWRDSWFWTFTPLSVRRIAAEVFPEGDFTVEVFGNVLAATSFLYGLAAQELGREELAVQDSDYAVTIALRAVKPLEDAMASHGRAR
jgi:SAM-dependent methyltransferase